MSAFLTTWCLFGVVLAASVCLVLGVSNTSCPSWFYYNNTTNECECKGKSGQIICNHEQRTALVADGLCVTSADGEGFYIAGNCPLSYRENHTNRVWSELPSNPDMLNATMCGPYNREGLLCGRCIDGYGFPVYSPDMKCVNCSGLSLPFSICFYLFIEFVPLTLFFVCVVIFHLNITAGPLLGYFMFCQLYYEETIGINRYIFDYIRENSSQGFKVLFYISQTLSEMWNLLFFKSLIPPFCISNKLRGIHIQILTLVPAVYVVLLVFTLCVLVELHARDCKVIRCFSKPFTYILNTVTISGISIMHAFATCVFLSSTTIAYNVAALILTTFMFSNIDTQIIADVLFIDPFIYTFSHEHCLYLVVAAVPCVCLVLVPALLLCVYPTRLYQYLSRFISARRQLAITSFTEALHNCFKDGLNGTRDYRALAGVIILALPFIATIKETIGGYSAFCVLSYTYLGSSLLISYVRPCKSLLANLSLSYHSIVLGILTYGFHLWERDLSTGTEALELTFIIIPFVSHVLVLSWMGYTVFQYVKARCGLDFGLRLFKVHWTGLVSAAKQCWQRQSHDYQLIQSLNN